MRRVALATGVELAVHEFGAGEPVLLLHAWGETHRVFDRLIPLLPHRLHVLMPDQRGVGESAKPGDGYAITDAAADIVALLDALGLATSWVVGTSSGGYVAQQVAIDHPGRVKGLVLIGAPSNLSGPPPAIFSKLLWSFHDPVTRDDVEALNNLLPLHTHVPRTFLDDQVTAGLTIPRHVWRGVLEGLCSAVPPIHSGKITVPTLILWGKEDDVLPRAQADELVAAIPDSRLLTYERTGHLVLWEQPERVAGDLTEFITRSSR